MSTSRSLPACFVVLLFLVAACDSNSSNGNATGDVGVRPSAPAVLQMTTTTPAWPLGVSGPTCQAGALFTPPLTLVIANVPFNASIDTVTFHLIDGSAAGGPSITFPRPQLTQLFGSTAIVGSRSLPFAPAFVCPSATLQAIDAAVVLDTGQQLTASVALR